MNSQALALMDRILGLSGSSSGEQYTTLDDGNVQQVIEISPIARRSLTESGTTGIFDISFNNLHSGASLNSNPINPYNLEENVSLTSRVNIWPVPVPRGLDVWLIGANAMQVGTDTNVSWCQLLLTMPSTFQALYQRRSSMGVPIQITNDLSYHSLTRWDTLAPDDILTSGSARYSFETENGEMYQHYGLRIRRGTTIDFITNTTGAAEIDCHMIVGLFPEGLGQDVAT